MALPDALKLVNGTAIIVADTTDYANNQSFGTRTHQIDLTGVADSAYRQSEDIDFGVNRAPFYRLRFSCEFQATPTAGAKVIFYIAWSEAVAAAGFDAGVGLSDADYTGYATNADAAIEHADKIAEFTCTADATTVIQIASCPGHFRAKARYGVLVVRNESGAAMFTDAVEIGVLISPVEHQVQDSV